MADQLPIRYYKPREDFKFDITDIQNFVYDMSRCIKCKGCTWVEHTYMPGAKFMTRCPSAAKYRVRRLWRIRKDADRTCNG